jgi:hypothetical protein
MPPEEAFATSARPRTPAWPGTPRERKASVVGRSSQNLPIFGGERRHDDDGGDVTHEGLLDSR